MSFEAAALGVARDTGRSGSVQRDPDL